MEFLFEILFELFFEIFLQLILELGFHGLAESIRKDRKVNPFLALLGYCLMGAIAGAISLWVFPEHWIRRPALQYVNLILSPLLLGAIFVGLGLIRRRYEKDVSLNRFWYGFVFALSVGLLRFFFAK